jgi:small subunit ribosomal protein S1
MSSYNVNIEEFLLWAKGDTDNFLKEESYIYISNDSQGVKGSLSKGLAEKMKHEFYNQIKLQNKAYVATVLAKNRGGFLVDIYGVEAFLPGSLAAPNKIVDFDQFIGTQVNVMIEDYLKSIGTFIVSNKKYIKHILPIKIKELDHNIKYVGIVTDTAKFGIFIEIEEFFTGLLHTSKMDEETLRAFRNNEFSSHDPIDVYIKEINDKNKIVLSSHTPEQQEHIDKLEAIAKEIAFKEATENAFKVGESYDGLITSVKMYGAFARIWNGKKTVSGLILNKDQSIEINDGDKMKIKIKTAEDDKYFFEI